MPNSAARSCLDCSRRALADSKYCQDHQASNARSDSRREQDAFRNRDSVRKLYKSAKWQVTRRILLKRDILCCSCGNQASTQCDHIVSARTVLDELGLDEFFNPQRCQGLCASCHSAKTAIECGWAGSKGTAIRDGDLTDDCCKHFTIVCGLPGAGKSYYVCNHAQQGELIWDMDVVLSAAAGQAIHTGVTGALQSLLAARDAFVQMARWSNQRVWMIISNRESELSKRLLAAGASVVPIECDESVRLQRLAARPWPPPPQQQAL